MRLKNIIYLRLHELYFTLVGELYPETCTIVKYISFPRVYKFCSGTSLTLLITVVIRCTTSFNIKIFYLSPKECIYVFCIIFTKYNQSFTKQHLLLIFQWRDSVLTATQELNLYT